MILTCKEVYSGLCINTLKQTIDELIVSTNRNALITVVEVVVVENQSHRETFDDERRKLRAFSAPLFLRVIFDEAFVDILTDEGECLLFEITRLRHPGCLHFCYSFGTLLINFRLSLSRCLHAPHFTEGVHIERQVIEFAMVVRHRRVGISVERHYRVDKIPYLLIGCMEDMRSVLMHINTLDIFAIDIATELWPLVYHQTLLPLLMSEVCECGAEKAGAYN